MLDEEYSSAHGCTLKAAMDAHDGDALFLHGLRFLLSPRILGTGTSSDYDRENMWVHLRDYVEGAGGAVYRTIEEATAAAAAGTDSDDVSDGLRSTRPTSAEALPRLVPYVHSPQECQEPCERPPCREELAHENAVPATVH